MEQSIDTDPKSATARHEVLEMSSLESDNLDIHRLGYTAELQRRFGMVSMIGLTSSIMVTWEGLLVVFVYGLQNGGPAGLIYAFIACSIGYGAIVASLAELVSMTPSAAGQYHWVWLLAPQKYRKFLSFITGWQIVLAWQACFASASYLTGQIIQGLVVLTHPNYSATRWQGTLLLYAVLLFSALFNISLARWLHYVEGIILVIHLAGFFIVLIPVLYLGEHVSAKDVFANWLNRGGYSSGTSFFVGLITPMFAFLGVDGAIHMSEEVIDAKRVVPRSVMASFGINTVMGLAMLLGILFCIGNIDDALSTSTGFPFIEIFTQSLGSVKFAVGLSSLILVLCICAGIAIMAAASRITFAFARDGGLPGSATLRKVHGKDAVPLWAILFSIIVTLLLGLINVGSSTAFNAVISLVVSSYLATYAIPIGLLAWRRYMQDPALSFGPWTLGKWGLPVNLIALGWSAITFFFSFWPTVTPVEPVTMNWAVVLWSAGILSGIGFYYVKRDQFTGPKIHSI